MKITLPQELEPLKQLPQWVLWRLETLPGMDKPTKPPYSPITGNRAESNNPATWGTYEQAAAMLERDTQGYYQGLGIMFAGGLYGVDIDACIDPLGRISDPTAAAIVDAAKRGATASELAMMLEGSTCADIANAAAVVMHKWSTDGASEWRVVSREEYARYFANDAIRFFRGRCRRNSCGDVTRECCTSPDGAKHWTTCAAINGNDAIKAAAGYRERAIMASASHVDVRVDGEHVVIAWHAYVDGEHRTCEWCVDCASFVG